MDLFKFFKKKDKKAEDVKQAEAEVVTPEKKITEEDLSKEIIVHVMPERFRLARATSHKAKKTGLVILAAGFLFLIAASAALYYFLFGPGSTRHRKQTVATPAVEEKKATTTPKKETKPKTEEAATSVPLLPADAGQATSSVATSTADVETKMTAGKDTDNDGLTDKEEELLGSNAGNKDTDNDGYSDQLEIINLYDPASFASDRLTKSSRIKKYSNSSFDYSVLQPAGWMVSAVGGNDSIIFKTPDNQFAQIIAEPNVDKETIESWFKKQFNVSVIEEGKKIAGSGWQGVRSEDGLTVYLTDNKNNYIFTITYNLGESNILEYKNVFEMMLKSFAVNG